MMINLKSLITLLPEYFRKNDTYKDNQGKGILERFLEIVGEYITEDESIKYEIDHILDIIDVMNTRDVFLDYIYEFLAYPPQDYHVEDGSPRYRHDPPDYIWNLEPGTPIMDYSLIGYLDTSSGKRYTDIDRRLIRYAISLYKIRGTARFYEVLLKAYYKFTGYKLDPDISINPREIKSIYDSGYQFDNDLKFDENYIDCYACLYYTIDLTNINVELNELEKNRLRKTLEKYAPINVIVQVVFNYLNLTIIKDGPSDLAEDVVIKREDIIYIGYENVIRVTLYNPEIRFLGWYDNEDNLLSPNLRYNLLTNEKELTLKVKFENY